MLIASVRAEPAFVFLVLAFIWSLRAVRIGFPRWSTALPAYAIGAIAAYWTIDRIVGFLPIGA